MAALIYGGGLRVRECCELRVTDLDFDQGLIFVRGRQRLQGPLHPVGRDGPGRAARPPAGVGSSEPRRPGGETGWRVATGRRGAEVPERGL